MIKWIGRLVAGAAVDGTKEEICEKGEDDGAV